MGVQKQRYVDPEVNEQILLSHSDSTFVESLLCGS